MSGTTFQARLTDEGRKVTERTRADMGGLWLGPPWEC